MGRKAAGEATAPKRGRGRPRVWHKRYEFCASEATDFVLQGVPKYARSAFINKAVGLMVAMQSGRAVRL